MSSLADRYTKPDTRTKFERWVDSLRDDHKAIILEWLNDPAISNVKIVEMIRDDDPADDFVGYRANKDAVAMWRRSRVSA